jgi:N-ethylmaleimide reductase
MNLGAAGDCATGHDLVDRLRDDLPLNDADPITFYGGDATGYLDYPVATRV